MIERAPEVVAKVVSHRPFKCADEIKAAIRKELFDLNEEACVRVLRAHPELAPINPQSMTSASQSEQARLNLISNSNEFKAQLEALNTRYQNKVAFPFITALVRHKDMDSVITEFETRLSADRGSELKQALEQVAMVSSSRVEAVFESGSSN